MLSLYSCRHQMHIYSLPPSSHCALLAHVSYAKRTTVNRQRRARARKSTSARMEPSRITSTSFAVAVDAAVAALPLSTAYCRLRLLSCVLRSTSDGRRKFCKRSVCGLFCCTFFCCCFSCCQRVVSSERVCVCACVCVCVCLSVDSIKN